LPLVALTISPDNTADVLVQALIGTNNVPVSNLVYSGSSQANGLFTSNPTADGLELDTGIILSTGQATAAIGPNNSDAKSFIFGGGGDADLDLIAAKATRDAVVLEFDFEAIGNLLSFRYIFASEEYNEFTNTTFNDVFAFYLDGVNMATIGGSSVSINSLNKQSNGAQFIDNSFAAKTPFGLTTDSNEFDGFSRALLISVPLSAGTHHLKLAIADVDDASFDSAVFIEAGSFTTQVPEIVVFDGSTEISNNATLVFDNTTLGVAVKRAFTLHNIGNATLTLSSPRLTTGFSFVETFPSQIATSSSVNLNLLFDAAQVGDHTGTLTFSSNDSDESNLQFNLQARVNAAAVVAAPVVPVAKMQSQAPKHIPVLAPWAFYSLSSFLALLAMGWLRKK